MSEKYKKKCMYLNYVEHLLILAYRLQVAGYSVTGCNSILAFASSVAIPVGIISSAVGKKSVQSLQELKSTSQLYRKRRRSMIQ